MPDQHVHIPGELRVADAQLVGQFFVNGFHRPAGIQFGCDRVSMSDEGHATGPLHSL
jgi:hypothetical protein